MSAKNQKARISAKKLFRFAGILIVFGYAAFILVKQQITLSQLEDIRAKKQECIAAAELENQALRDEYGKTSTDEYLEQAIRKNLGFVRPNERIFIDISQQH